MSLGVIAILLAVNDGESDIQSISLLMSASLLVLVAALTDRLDGKVARAFGVSSELGKELDSLSDLISFGVAPIIIAWKISFIQLGVFGYLVSLIFPMAGAYRLARFNCTKFDNFFRGIPITIAGGLLAIINLFNLLALESDKFGKPNLIFTTIIVLALSYFMVCNIKIKKR
jgi:CDP-diacylglycerol--serine O-phosphatidyltransferase